MFSSILCKSFNFGRRSRSKTQLGLAVGRLKLLLNKKAAAMASLRKEIADLLATGKSDSARIRVRMKQERVKKLGAPNLALPRAI